MSLLDALLLDPQRINVWLAIRSGGKNKGCGTQSDPYNAGTEDRFDALMNSFGPNTRVHLGPGIFKTRGYTDADPAQGWQLKPGMKIVGSGIDVTTLQLVGAQDPASGTSHYFIVGHRLDSSGELMNYCEIEAMTLDCNLGPQSGTKFACGAARIMGHHSRVRQVKAIHWGTKTSGPSCLVIAMITADPSWSTEKIPNTGIEECIAIDPDSNTGQPVTVLHAGPKAAPGTLQEGVGWGPFIRNCYVDCGNLSNPLTLDIRALSMGWCQEGIVEGNEIHRVRIGGPYLESASAREIVIRANTFDDVRRGPYLKLGQKSGTQIGLGSLSFSGSSAPYTVTATTVQVHKLNQGDRVELVCLPDALSGLFAVTEIVSTTQFKYRTPGPMGALGSGTMEKVFGVGRVVVESNTVKLAKGADGETAIHLQDNDQLSLQAPDHVYGDVIIRGNKVLYVDGIYDPTYSGTGIEVNGAKNLSVQDNVLALAPANPIKDARAGSVKYFNNTTPSGGLIQGLKDSTGQKYDELQTEVEDALVLALLRRR